MSIARTTALLALALATVALPAAAAEITWQPAYDIRGPEAVFAGGSTVQAENLTPHTTDDVVVHGVTFRSSVDVFGQRYPNRPLAGFSTGDAALDTLLGGFDHASRPAVVTTLGDGRLVPGETYVVQVFLTDLRGLDTSDRSQVYGDAVGVGVTLDARGSDPGVTTFGQTAVGVFTADGTSQELSIQSTSTGATPNAHITAYQIRQVPAGTVIVPEPLLAGTSIEAVSLGWTPGAQVGYGIANLRGSTPLPGCPGEALGLRSPYFLGAHGVDDDGAVRVGLTLPPVLAGDRVHLQAASVADCAVGPRLDVDVD